MNKFSLIALGENFEFQGEQYCKTGPLTATSVDGKRQRMIPRSAMVKPLQQPVPAAAATPEQASPLDATLVSNAFEHYHDGCLAWLQQLAEGELTAETAAQLREALESARRRFLQESGLS